MIYNNLKIAWRNLYKHGLSSVINILGLAIGITCCIFIALYIWSELQVDQFHANKDSIYRVNQTYLPTGKGGSLTSFPLGTSLKNEYPWIKQIVRLGGDGVSIRAGKDAYFFESRFYWADATFFDVFSFKLLQGDPSTALQEPHSLVITEAMAKKYFKDADPIGRVVDLKIYDGDKKMAFTITGVMENVPKGSHIQFDFLAPMVTAMEVYPTFETWWDLNWVYTYVRVGNGPLRAPDKSETASFFSKYAGKGLAENTGLNFQPLTQIHLYSSQIDQNTTAGVTNLYLFGSVGIFILILACINFINLSTARSELRRKEIGVRKTLGAARRQLIAQFLMESFLTAGIVLFLSFAITFVAQSYASRYLNDVAVLYSLWLMPLVFVGAVLLIGILAGLYPAVFLSGFHPVQSLRPRQGGKGFRNLNVRQVLVVFQFTISIALIAGTLVVRKQLAYFENADLGYTMDQLITIPVDDRELQSKMPILKEAVAAQAGVAGVTASGESMPAIMNYRLGFSWEGIPEDEKRGIDVITIDYDYFDVLEVSMLEGRNISRRFGTDDSLAYIINEAARKMMGVKEAVGQEIVVGGRRGTVVGVVKDIHHYSLHRKVEPIAYFPRPGGSRISPDNLIIKVSGSAIGTTMASVKKVWETFSTDRPFEYHFADQDFSKAYEREEQFLQLFEIFSALAIIIACLGLMGLSSFVVSRRSKEIGIRKVMGATASQILVMLTKGFSMPVLIAFILAVPCVYYAMTRWLDKFAYKVTIDPDVLILSGLMAWVVAFSFIAFQSIRAARVNPAKTLKEE